MDIVLTGCFFLSELQANENIKKNDVEKIKILVDRNRKVVRVPFQKLYAGGIEYRHQIDTEEKEVEKELLLMLIAYKYLRNRIENTDILFQLLPGTFTLEDIRRVYEKITGKSVDKSNFRKKIVKYCEAIDQKQNEKRYRPAQLYRYKANVHDTWI